MDVKEEVIESILAHLEVREPAFIRLYMPTALKIKISFYGAPPEEVAKQFPVIAVRGGGASARSPAPIVLRFPARFPLLLRDHPSASPLRHSFPRASLPLLARPPTQPFFFLALQALLRLGVSPRNGAYHVATADLANAAGTPPGIVLRDLSTVAASRQIAFASPPDDGPTFRLLHQDADVDELAEPTWRWVTSCLVHQVRQLDTTYAFFRRASRTGSQEESEGSLREDISVYMARSQASDAMDAEGLVSGVLDLKESPLSVPTPALLASVRSAMRHLSDGGNAQLSPLTLAKMLHGLASPAYPADAWRKRAGPFWASQCHIDFATVLGAARAVHASEGAADA